jgi:hypothetical protein
VKKNGFFCGGSVVAKCKTVNRFYNKKSRHDAQKRHTGNAQKEKRLVSIEWCDRFQEMELNFCHPDILGGIEPSILDTGLDGINECSPDGRIIRVPYYLKLGTGTLNQSLSLI